MKTPNTIPTPHRCPGGCGVPVSIERIEFPTNESHRRKPFASHALKRAVINEHGDLHTCPRPFADLEDAKRADIRAERRFQRLDSRDGSIYAFSRAERRRRWRRVRNAMLFPMAPFEKRGYGMCAQ